MHEAFWYQLQSAASGLGVLALALLWLRRLELPGPRGERAGGRHCATDARGRGGCEFVPVVLATGEHCANLCAKCGRVVYLTSWVCRGEKCRCCRDEPAAVPEPARGLRQVQAAGTVRYGISTEDFGKAVERLAASVRSAYGMPPHVTGKDRE